MAFLKNIWRTNSRHKKLSEEWALATSLQDFSKTNDFEEYEPTIFDVKYLGNTTVEAARSEETTAEAVKQVITAAKSNWKKLQRVSLYVTPKGIEMCDTVSGETILQVSIYKISYCSADAAHNNVFAFINTTEPSDNESCPSGSESDAASSKDSDGTLVLHAFLCQKRKVAQNVTLTVAKSFETAFHMWQDETDRRRATKQRRDTVVLQEAIIKNHQQQHPQPQQQQQQPNETDTVRNMLIDFNSEMDVTVDLCSKDHPQYFQNTWVSFEDEQGSNESLNLQPPLNYKTNMWDNGNLIFSS